MTANTAFSVQAVNVDEYVNQLPTGVDLALMVQKAGAPASAVDFHSQQTALPASTQKVITALVALIQLGPDFRLITTFETKGSMEGGVLKGDLVVRFGAGPTLKRQDTHNMVVTLKKSGVTQIARNVLIDTSIFASHDRVPGRPWNDMTRCFGASPAAVTIDRNCLSASLYGMQEPNDFAFIRVASYYPAIMLSQVCILTRGSAEAQYCELDTVPGDLNYYTLTGCLPQRTDPLSLAFAIQDGVSYAGVITKDELKQVDITYNSTLLHQALVNGPGKVVTNRQSAPLYDLLKTMLEKPDNMIVDTVFRMIGYIRFNVSDTWRAGSDVARQILRQQTDVDIGNTIIADGSGLSHHNPIIPTTMVQVLQYIAQHNNELNFITMLPLAGHDSSLQYHAGLHQTGMDGKISTKTGSLQRAYNLVGFIITASGQRIVFMQYSSGYAIEPADQRNRRVPLMRFESRLYKDTYQDNQMGNLIVGWRHQHALSGLQ